MSKRDWSKAAGRSRVARQGAEAVGRAGKGARREADDAEMVTKILRCVCGHRGKVELPAALLAGRRFRCTSCGKVLR